MRILLIALLGTLAGCAFSHQTVIKVSGNGLKYTYPAMVSGNMVNMEVESNATYEVFNGKR